MKRTKIVAGMISAVVVMIILFGAVIAPAAAGPFPTPTPHSTNGVAPSHRPTVHPTTTPTPTPSPTQEPELSATPPTLEEWPSPRWLGITRTPACSVQVVLDYGDPVYDLDMCWQPACTMSIRDGLSPSIDCGDVRLDPDVPEVPTFELAYESAGLVLSPCDFEGLLPTTGGGCVVIPGCTVQFAFVSDPFRVEEPESMVCGIQVTRPPFKRAAAARKRSVTEARVKGVKYTATPAATGDTGDTAGPNGRDDRDGSDTSLAAGVATTGAQGWLPGLLWWVLLPILVAIAFAAGWAMPMAPPWSPPE